MGLFARKPEPQTGPDQDAYREKQEELNELRLKVEMVKDEYQATVASLMGVKRELNQKKMELDSAGRELAKISEKARRTAEITGTDSIDKFNRTAETLLTIRAELRKSKAERGEIESAMTEERSALRIVRAQHAEYRKELEEARADLYDAKEEIAKIRPQGPSPDGAELAGHGSAGVIEAASAVVGSLKAKLNSTQKELEAAKSRLEEERAGHEETRRRLES